MKVTLLFLCLVLDHEASASGKIVSPIHGTVDISQIRDSYSETSYRDDSVTKSQEEFFFLLHHTNPFVIIHHTSSVKNKLIMDMTYTIGELGMRVIEPELINPNANKHMIVAGDSNVFGVGVENDGTLPVLLSKSRPDYHPYNFGVRGGGPHNTLGVMEFFPWEKLIHEPEGYFIYNFYDFLLERAIGAKSYIAWNGGTSPYYQLNDQDVAEYVGPFRDQFLTKVYQQIISIKWLNDLLPTLPRHRHQHNVLVAKMFLKMKQIYLSKFPKGHFIVAINNAFVEMVPGRLHDLYQELRKNNIQAIILPINYLDNTLKHYDAHLNEKGHKLESDLILKNLTQL